MNTIAQPKTGVESEKPKQGGVSEKRKKIQQENKNNLSQTLEQKEKPSNDSLLIAQTYQNILGKNCDIKQEKVGEYERVRIIPKTAEKRSAYPIEIVLSKPNNMNIILTDYKNYTGPTIRGENLTVKEVIDSANLCASFLNEGYNTDVSSYPKFKKTEINVQEKLKEEKTVEKKTELVTNKEKPKEEKTIEKKIEPVTNKEKPKEEKTVEKKKDGVKKKFWDRKIGKIISAPVRIPYDVVTGTGKRVWDGISMNGKKGWNTIESIFKGSKNLVIDNTKWLIDGPKRMLKRAKQPFKK